MGNQDFGYFAGGKTPSGPVSTIDRVDYTNDTATATAVGPLSAIKYGGGTTGNSSFGYYGGGETPVVSTVDRIDYTNDTATASQKGLLSLARGRLAATSSQENHFHKHRYFHQ